MYQVGLPAKSGVGGGIVTVVPGRFAIATFSPRVDANGNSTRGILAIEDLAARWNLHLFHRE
jgi:glutaminase